ncbi:MAG: hypothetical protein J5982_04025 [Bacilli bacterium]|nr:hypothetical protein [Bacilli bacterium]
MAQLNIEQAGIGYDTVGISNFLNKLNLDVIDDLISKLHNNMGTLRAAVDQVWAGQSANAFKEKLERDSETMIQTLEGIKDDVKAEFAQIAQNVDNYDSAIAESLR